MKTRIAAVFLLTVACAALHADEPSAILKTDDKAALTAAIDKTVTVEGKVASASWSKSGKVMNVKFEGEPNFVVAVFQKNKDKLDTAFNGDLAKTLTGATIRINGKLAKYGGRDEAYADATQLILSMPTQLTIVTPADAATQPATTQPATAPAAG